MKAAGVDLSNAGGFEEIRKFHEHLSYYKIIVFDGFKPNRVMFSTNSLSTKKLYLLYSRNLGHYNVIKGAMAKKYICNGCDTLYDDTHKCDKVCSLCTPSPPCTKDQTKHCGTCNRQFLSQNFFWNHLTQSERQTTWSVETGMPKL